MFSLLLLGAGLLQFWWVVGLFMALGCTQSLRLLSSPWRYLLRHSICFTTLLPAHSGVSHWLGQCLLVPRDMEVGYISIFKEKINTFQKKSFISGFINSMYSWRVFTPIARLSFVMYLIHDMYVDILSSWYTFMIAFSQFNEVSPLHQKIWVWVMILKIHLSFRQCLLLLPLW